LKGREYSNLIFKFETMEEKKKLFYDG